LLQTFTTQNITLQDFIQKTVRKWERRESEQLKQQTSQKMILLVQHIAKMSLCCEVTVMSSFVIFAVLVKIIMQLIAVKRD